MSVIGNVFGPHALAIGRRAGAEPWAPGRACEGRGQLPRAALCFSSRTAWVQKIKAASEQYIDTEKKKREKAYQGSWPCPGQWEPATKGPRGAGAGLDLTFRSGLLLLLLCLQ